MAYYAMDLDGNKCLQCLYALYRYVENANDKMPCI